MKTTIKLILSIMGLACVAHADSLPLSIDTETHRLRLTKVVKIPSSFSFNWETGATLTVESGGTVTFVSGSTLNLFGSAVTTLSGLRTAIGAGEGDALTTGPLSQFAATTSAQLAGVLSDETGTGAAVLAISPALTTPDLGTPSAITLTNGTGLPLTTGITGTLPAGNGGTGITALGTGVAPALGENVTGSGGIVLASSPTLETPVITAPRIATVARLGPSADDVLNIVRLESGWTTHRYLYLNVPTEGGAGVLSLDATLTVLNDITLTTDGGPTRTLNIGAGGTLGSNAFTSAAYVPQTTTVNGHALSANVTVSKSDVGLGSVENTALSTWTGSSAITTLGTIGTGTWQGSVIAPAYLGTGSSITTKYLRGDGTWQTIAGGGAGGTKTIATLTPLSNQPPASNYATLGTRNSIAVLGYADGSTTGGVWAAICPDGATLTSGLTVTVHWAASTATSGDVVWRVSIWQLNTDLDSASFDTATTATATTNATAGVITSTAITTTNTDGLTAGSPYLVFIERVGGDAADTMTDTAEMQSAEVKTAN